MESSTIFVRNLSYEAKEQDLEELFGKFGQIVRVYIPKEYGTTNSKGFAFVEMESKAVAEKAMAELNEKVFMRRTIFLNEAQAKPRGPQHDRAVRR